MIIRCEKYFGQPFHVGCCVFSHPAYSYHANKENCYGNPNTDQIRVWSQRGTKKVDRPHHHDGGILPCSSSPWWRIEEENQLVKASVATNWRHADTDETDTRFEHGAIPSHANTNLGYDESNYVAIIALLQWLNTMTTAIILVFCAENNPSR